jgi:hypothetical protein
VVTEWLFETFPGFQEHELFETFSGSQEQECFSAIAARGHLYAFSRTKQKRGLYVGISVIQLNSGLLSVSVERPRHKPTFLLSSCCTGWLGQADSIH